MNIKKIKTPFSFLYSRDCISFCTFSPNQLIVTLVTVIDCVPLFNPIVAPKRLNGQKKGCVTLHDRSTRSTQSKEWIILALLQLMENKVYSDISISEITHRAGLARQTFYRNYQDKDDILFDYFHSLYGAFWNQLNESDVFTEEMFITLFRLWQSQSPDALIQNIINKDRKIRQIIYRSLDTYISAWFSRRQRCVDGAPKEITPLHYYAQKTFASNIHTLLVEWTLSHYHLSAEEMGAVAYRLTGSSREILQ